MVRFYALNPRVNDKKLLSTEITQQEIKDIYQKYNEIQDECVYSVSLKKELKPLKNNHGNLYLKQDKNTIIYYGNMENIYVIGHYDINKKSWSEKITKNVIFDHSLLFLATHELDEYNSEKEFAKQEFLDDDGELWLNWKQKYWD